MCLLIVLYKVVRGWPIVLAANRDERYDRAGEPPLFLSKDPPAIGGRDLKGGGTWLGVNSHALVVGVTNRRTSRKERNGLRSRGLLCLDALAARSAKEALSIVSKKVKERCYNPFDLFALDPNSAHVLYYDRSLKSAPITPGLHALTVSDFDDANDPRIRRVKGLLSKSELGVMSQDVANVRLEVKHKPGESGVSQDAPRDYLRKLLARLKIVVSDHAPRPGGASICMHSSLAGTLSSTILAIKERALADSVYLFSQGAPCSNPFRDFSSLFKHLSR